MKELLMTLLAASAMVLVLTAESQALDNKVEASYESGSGEGFFVGNLDKDAYALSYTRYLQGLADDGSPYGAREFLQHPSYLAFSLERSEYDYRSVPPGSAFERDMDEYKVSGIFYVGDGRMTGLGLSYAYLDGNLTGSQVASIEQKTLALKINHYLTGGLRLGLGYERREIGDYPWAPDRDMLSFDASALIEKYWLAAWYSNSNVEYTDEDLEVMGLELGVYPTREIGVFTSYEVLWEYLESTTTLRLRGEYWFSDKAKIDVVYKRVEEGAGHYFVGETGTLGLGLLF